MRSGTRTPRPDLLIYYRVVCGCGWGRDGGRAPLRAGGEELGRADRAGTEPAGGRGCAFRAAHLPGLGSLWWARGSASTRTLETCWGGESVESEKENPIGTGGHLLELGNPEGGTWPEGVGHLEGPEKVGE